MNVAQLIAWLEQQPPEAQVSVYLDEPRQLGPEALWLLDETQLELEDDQENTGSTLLKVPCVVISLNATDSLL